MLYSASDINRRDFVRTVSAGMALLPAVGTDVLAELLGPPKSRVALVRTTDRKRGVTEVLKLLDLRPVKGKRVVLKPNFNSADETPGSTHNDTLSQLVTELHERDARSVTLGESSGPPQTRGVMEKKGTFDLARDLPLRRRRLRADPGDRLGAVLAGRHPLARGIPPAPPGRRRRVQGLDLLPQDARLRRRLHDVAQAGGRPHAQADPPRHASVARHAPDDRGAEHRLQAEPDRARRRGGVHRRRARRAAS